MLIFSNKNKSKKKKKKLLKNLKFFCQKAFFYNVRKLHKKRSTKKRNYKIWRWKLVRKESCWHQL